MTTQADHARNLAGALGVLTAWRSRDALGKDVVDRILVDAATDAGGWAPVVVAVADLAAGMLGAVEACATAILSDPELLAKAWHAVVDDGNPMTARSVAYDTSAVLDRLGRYLASLPDPT